jgi:hypothetical protein
MNTARRPAPVATSCRPLSRLEADSPSRAPDASCCGQQLGGPSTRTISATRGRRRRRACCEGGNPRRRGCKGPVDPAAARALPADDLGRAGLASAETWRPTGVKPSLEGGGAGFSVTNFRTLRGAAASLSSRKALPRSTRRGRNVSAHAPEAYSLHFVRDGSASLSAHVARRKRRCASVPRTHARDHASPVRAYETGRERTAATAPFQHVLGFP